MRNILIGFALSAVLVAGGIFFKMQNDQITGLKRNEDAQKREVDNLRRQMKKFSDQALHEASNAQMLAAAEQKRIAEERAAELAHEQMKLDELLQRRAAAAAGKSATSPADDRARLKVLKDNLSQFEAQAKKDANIIKSVNSDSSQAHTNERKARDLRHQDRVRQIHADEGQLRGINKQISDLTHRKNQTVDNTNLMYALNNTQHQFETDLANLHATDQADQASFEASKQSFETDTQHTKSEIAGEENGLNTKVSASRAEIATIERRLDVSREQNTTRTSELADLDVQINAQKGVIATLSAKALPAANPGPAATP